MKEQINEDIKNYLKAKDPFKLMVVRGIKGAIQLEEINKKAELTDDEIINVISKQIKTRKDSIVEFEKGNREDLVKKTQDEIDFLMTYMPPQLSEEEITNIVNDVFAKVNPTSIKDLGLIMKEVTPLLKGKADISLISSLIKDKLNNIN